MTDIVISNIEWTDINTEGSITVGTDIRIQNKGNYGVLLQASSSQPDVSSVDGAYITSADNPTPYVDFESETETIYARVYYESDSTRNCRLYISII